MEIFQLLHIMHHTHSYFCSKTMSSFTFKTEECDRELIFSHPTLFMKKDNVLNSFGPSRIPCTIITGLYPSMQRPVSSNRSSALCVFISLHVHTEWATCTHNLLPEHSFKRKCCPRVVYWLVCFIVSSHTHFLFYTSNHQLPLEMQSQA